AAITGEETHGKVLLTTANQVRDPEALHGKIVVGQGGCIAFVTIPDGGKPLPLIAPEGSRYDGRNQVSIDGKTYRFGELLDLQGAAERVDDYEFADRCGQEVIHITP
ncbi:MAG: hypothetical protein Q4Q03_08160, partial [Bowdeniella nasicola]|nr:hypothetical protein [Bowdeniella nasicola]